MKKSKKLLATLLGATIFATSFFSGGCNSVGLGEGAIEGRPNYDVSESADTYTIWSYGQVCSDHYFINSQIRYFIDENGETYSMQTFERTQELLEANFNRVFINYSTFGEWINMTDEEWESSYIRQTLDYCQQLGLKAFCHGSYSYGLAKASLAVDKYGVQHLTRIVPDIAQECIEEYYEDAYLSAKEDALIRLCAIDEKDGSITSEITGYVKDNIAIEVARDAMNMIFSSEDAKREWIEGEKQKRFNETDVAEFVRSAIDVRAEEFARENTDKYAKLAYYIDKGDNVFFRSWDEYKEYVAETMDHIIQHPAFMGYSLVDEPAYWTLPLVAETGKIYKEVASEYYGKDDFYLMFNMLPPNEAPHMKDQYCEGGQNLDFSDAYVRFLQHYKEELLDTGILDYYQYDDYPIFNSSILSSFLRGHQLTAEFGRDNDVSTKIVMQSYGSDGVHRFNEYEDVLWQANIGAAFGKTEFSYYTWWPILNTADGLLEDRTFPLTRYGERTELFYSIKKVNGELQYLGKYLTHFKYVDSTYIDKSPMPTGANMLNGLRRPTEYTKLGDLIINEETLQFRLQQGGLLLATELYDEENDQKGYFIINGTDPGVPSEMVVTVAFDGYQNVQIVQTNTTTNVALDDGGITLELGTGYGVFIMPY